MELYYRTCLLAEVTSKRGDKTSGQHPCPPSQQAHFAPGSEPRSLGARAHPDELDLNISMSRRLLPSTRQQPVTPRRGRTVTFYVMARSDGDGTLVHHIMTVEADLQKATNATGLTGQYHRRINAPSMLPTAHDALDDANHYRSTTLRPSPRRIFTFAPLRSSLQGLGTASWRVSTAD